MITIIIPAYNEEGAIGEVVSQVQSSMKKANFESFEIIVIDDCSTDLTGEIAKDAGAKVIQHLQNQGYGRSIKNGIREAKNDTIVIIDADGSYPAEAIAELLHKYGEGFDLVVGARQGAAYRESWYKFPLRKILGFIVQFACGRKIPDVNSGLRVFSKETITPILPLLSDSFSFTTSLTLAYFSTFKFVKYVPIPYSYRTGKSKVKLFRDSLRTLQYIVQALGYYNPIKLFLLLSICAVIFGLLIILFVELGLPSFVGNMLGLSLFTALLLFAIGLLAEILRQHSISAHK